MELFIPGPAGRLEAILWRARGEDGEERAPRAAAIVCHPHPLGGGTMHNNVVFRLARGLQNAGLTVVRFNFRGVEASDGQHHGEGGEAEDARAALDWLAAEVPGVPLWGSGFSFGSRTVAALALREPRLAHLLLVALPAKAYDCRFVRDVRVPGLCLMAGRDEFGNADDLRGRVPDLPEGLEVDEIPDVDHYFRGATPEVEARVRRHAQRTLEATP
jgi:alpha/beta superfamily hydrolase